MLIYIATNTQITQTDFNEIKNNQSYRVPNTSVVD